jgi:hypothetical protein
MFVKNSLTRHFAASKSSNVGSYGVEKLVLLDEKAMDGEDTARFKIR